MKKYLALLLIAIMAVSVLGAAGVMTTQKAAAADGVLVQPIVVQYQPGAKYTYLPKQFNEVYTNSMVTQGTKHFEAATGGAIYSSVSTRMGQAGGSHAQTGMNWQLKLPTSGPYSDWNTVGDMPCKVTMKVNYHIAAKGDSQTVAQVWWATGFYQLKTLDTVYGNDPIHSKSAIQTLTWQGQVRDTFMPSGSGINGYANAGVRSASMSAANAGQASGALTCSNIVLEFPAS